jgi:small subunit ribosomal protein S18
MAHYIRYKKFPTTFKRDVDYKDLTTLKIYLMESGRIIPSRISNVPPKMQRKLTNAIKIARFLALIPYTDAQ